MPTYPDPVYAKARRMYESAPIPHYLDFDDLPAWQHRQWLNAARVEVEVEHGKA